MRFLGEVDWSSLEVFFGEHGKLVALIGAFIGFMIVLLKYLHAKISEKERAEVRRDLKKLETALDNERQRVQQQMLTLSTKAAELDRKNAELTAATATIESREKKLNVVRTAFSGEEYDLWCVHTTRHPTDYNHKLWVHRHRPIVTIANLKGGVGKTTLTANLAAFLSHAGMRVLLIDVDYQGSLSNMLLFADQVSEVPANITKLLASEGDATTFKETVHRFESILPGSAIVSSAYEFASFENQLMIEYLLHEGSDDGRYRLARLLLNEDVSSTFDIVLIDAPPRLTAGTINALCASTHLLVPTVFDKLSAEAVGTFLNGVQVLKTRLNPMLDLLGVVGTLTHQQTGLKDREQQAKNIAMKQVKDTWHANPYFFSRHIPRREAIATVAGENLAYSTDDTVKRWFDELGQEVLERLNLPSFPPRPRSNGGQFPKQPLRSQPGAEA